MEPHTTTATEPRTAAATRARQRRKHERWAAELAAAGWTVTPPDDAPAPPAGPRLVAVVRPAGSGAAGRDSRVTICGPAGGPAPKPRANLDGAGGYERAAFIAGGQLVPARADSEAQTRPFVDLLAAQGYQVVGGWVVGRDVDGRRRASVEVREVTR